VGWYAALGLSVFALAAVGPGLAAAGAAGLFAGVFVVSASVSLYGLAACYYPVAIRGAGVGVSVAVGRVGAIAGPLLASALLGAGAGASGVLLALLPLAAVAGAATVALVAHPAVTD
jgi:AAHS family 3-hydroxyphenylpropionic acid transporter